MRGLAVVYVVGNVNAKVSSIFQGQWFWGPTRSEDIVTKQVFFRLILLRRMHPAVYFGFLLHHISSIVNQPRKQLELNNIKCQLIWFSDAIPRHAFVTWLAIKDKLSTPDRSVSW